MATNGVSPYELLVVDDEPQVIAALKDLLEDEFHVHAETSAKRALTFLANDPGICVIISDQRMPEMAGDEFLARARDLSAATRILITGYADLKAVIRAINEGRVFGYISKPWDPNHLMVTIHKAVEYYEMTRELTQERALLHNLMDSLPDAVFFKDASHRYLRVNRAKAAALGIADPSIAVGETAAAFFSSERAIRVEGEEDEILRTGTPIVDQIERIASADGAQRWFSTTRAPVFDDRGGVINLVCVARDITDRERSREALAESERRHRSLYNKTPVMMQSIGRDGRLISVSDYWCESLGYERDEAVGRGWTEFMAGESRERMEGLMRSRVGEIGQIKDLDCQFVCKDGRVIDSLLSVVAEHDDSGSFLAFLAVVVDVTDKKALQDQLLQAQKMEAVGQLTGGVAHDFNNLLTVVIGGLDVVLARDQDDPWPSVENALRAAERGAALVQRLLAFSRRQTLIPIEVEFNPLVSDMEELLRRTLGEHIEIEMKLYPELWVTLADRSHVENALLNLAINARDAMPGGGKLTIETGNVRLDEDYAARNAEVAVGDYVMLAVTDTGSGMPPDVVERAFEPFFTTKEIGKGSGLGLSMIYGFAKQSDGHVKIYSEVDHGTTFRLYLPRLSTTSVPAARPSADHSDHPRGGETILVVEDDADVRAFIAVQLHNLGYRVIEASDGPRALEVLESSQSIDLLLTDVVMPGGMTGLKLAEEAKRHRPTLRTLFSSGYTENSIARQGKLDPGLHFLPKPFRRQDLALKVRQALDASV